MMKARLDRTAVFVKEGIFSSRQTDTNSKSEICSAGINPAAHTAHTANLSVNFAASVPLWLPFLHQ